MSTTTTLSFVFDLGGGPTNADAVVLSDPAGAYGVRRADGGATVVAAGTAMPATGTGTYAYTFADPAPGLVYEYVVKATLGAATHWFARRLARPLPAYLDAAEADELAGVTLGLGAWSGASAPDKAAALARASDEIDRAMPYHGRRYAPDQPREFPRLAAEDPPPGFCARGARGAAVVWDWDEEAHAAVVPREVLLATLLQADADLAGDREPRLDAQHDGVVYDLTGTLAESYKRSTGPGVTTGLCRRAWLLVRRYRIRSGRLL